MANDDCRDTLDAMGGPLTCAECSDLLDAAADAPLAGQPLAQTWPGVAHHLARCPDCTLEYELLVTVLRDAKAEVL